MQEGRSGLRRKLREAASRALESGALKPIPTDLQVVEDGGLRFVVRVRASLGRKSEAAEREVSGNPFLPYDPSMFVADVSATHVALLNKFNVLDDHLLIVTREYRDQREPLTAEDFSALADCMRELRGLGFYNGGRVAGASQPHKHLQLVPLPLGPDGADTPIDAVVAAAGGGGELAAFRFAHRFLRLDGPPSPALVGSMTAALGCEGAPYNLLWTDDWILLVPRVRETFHGISVNALGFAGSLFVRDLKELDLVRSAGPMAILQSVAAPRS